MKKLKKVLLIIFCVCVCVGIQGCSSNNDTGAEKSTNIEQATNKDKNTNKDNKDNNSTDNSNSSETPDLRGNVVSINNNTIYVSEMKEDSNGVVTGPAAGTKESIDNAKSFKVSDSTDVIIRTQQDAENFTDSKGKISDIKQDSLINVWQKKEGNDFIATKIIVYSFKE